MKRFKAGDIVVPHDGSYAMGISEEGKLETVNGIQIVKRNFEVLSSECDLPARDSIIGPQRNSIILRALDNNQIVFIQSGNIKLSHRCNCCPNCGKEV